MMNNKKIGVSLFESLCGLILVSGVGISIVNLFIKNVEEDKFLAEANLPITLLKAVDMRVSMDGYNKDLWQIPNIKNRIELEEFAKKAFISKYNLECGKSNGWIPENDENRNPNKKVKTALIPCNLSFGKDNLFEIELKSRSNNNNNLYSVDLIMRLNKSYNINNDTILYENKLLRHLKAITPKTKKGLISANYFNYNDLTTPIKTMECKKLGSDCVIKVSWRTDGFSEALRLNGSNNMVNTNVSFAKTYKDSNERCLLWSYENNVYTNRTVDCGIGIYKNNTYANVDAVVDNSFINNDIVLDKECNLYDNDMNIIKTTKCGIITDPNSKKVIQLTNELQSDPKNKNSSKSLTTKELFAGYINGDKLNISQNMDVKNGSSIVNMNTLTGKKAELNETEMNNLDVKSKTLFDSNVEFTNTNGKDLVISGVVNLNGNETKTIQKDVTVGRQIYSNGLKINNNPYIKNGDRCDYKQENQLIMHNGELLKCRLDNHHRLKWLNNRDGEIGYFNTSCPTGWHKLRDADGRTLLGSGVTIDKYKGKLEYQVGNKGGEAFHRLTMQEMPSHNHKYKDAFYIEYWGDTGPRNQLGNQNPDNDNNLYVRHMQSEYTGGNASHENRMPFDTVVVCEYQQGKKEHQDFKEKKPNINDFWYPYPDELGPWLDYGDPINCSSDMHIVKPVISTDLNGVSVDTGVKKDYWIRNCKQPQEMNKKGREKNTLSKEIRYTGLINTITRYVRAQEIWTKAKTLYFDWYNVSKYYDCGSNVLNSVKKNDKYIVTLLCKVDKEREYQERLQKEGSNVILAYRDWGHRKKENKTFVEKNDFTVTPIKNCTEWDWIDPSYQRLKPNNQYRDCKITGVINGQIYDLDKYQEKRYLKPLCLPFNELKEKINKGEDVTNADTSCIVDFSSLFEGNKTFNQDISNWDVSNGKYFRNMFKDAKLFNQDISKWNVSKGRYFDGMFQNAERFNKPLNKWDVSNANTLNSMFSGAKAFNKNINDWNVSKVRDFNYMFNSAKTFNQPLNKWNVSKGESFTFMFGNTNDFNQNINDWNVHNGTDFDFMFSSAKSFNQPLNKWDMGKAKDLRAMFANANKFNQNINTWNVSNVKNFGALFQDCFNFNYPLNNWNTSKAESIRGMFNGTKSFNQPLDKWNVSNVKDFSFLFRGAESFNQNINNWNTSKGTNFSATFHVAESFNQPLNKWDVSHGTNFESMFNGAKKFNQNISNWNVNNSTNNDYFSVSSSLTEKEIPAKFKSI